MPCGCKYNFACSAYILFASFGKFSYVILCCEYFCKIVLCFSDALIDIPAVLFLTSQTFENLVA